MSMGNDFGSVAPTFFIHAPSLQIVNLPSVALACQIPVVDVAQACPEGLGIHDRFL